MAGKAQFPDEHSEEGEFVRQEDQFRRWISKNGEFPAEKGRYHLYISLACPWASRTLIVRNLKGLQDAIGVTVVDPIRDESGWAFRPDRDPVEGFSYLSEAYKASDPDYEGRVTVPVLWDKETRQIVNNSEDDICRMLDQEFEAESKSKLEFFPAGIEAEHKELSAYIYHNINNGVYMAGFSTSQRAYEKNCRNVFAALDQIEKRLAKSRFLFGKQPVEADWRLFCTLVRFDPVYYLHFKCNIRRILDYPNLQGYLLDLYQFPGIADTVDFDHIKRHYYMTHDEINPTRLVPIGPEMNLLRPHGRERLES
jgi:putative glutathione S-transferase